MKYYLISGEASGDLHASNLLKELKKRDPEAHCRAWGGDLLKAQGAELVKHYRDLAFMGFTEVLLNIRTILKNISFCKQDVLKYKPDVLILVDYPGFNLRIAEFAKARGIRVFYYISPQVWAWNSSRVHKIKRIVDRMFVILPFEKEFYNRYSFPVDFTGHPLLDAIENIKPDAAFRKKHNLSDKPIVALLPGSRIQEINRVLPVMLKLKPKFPTYEFVVAAAPAVPESVYRKSSLPVISGNTYELLRHAHAAIVTSGTATLETALFGVPEVVCYKGGLLSYLIARQLIRVKYISLVNLIMDKPVVKELIQGEFTEKNLEAELTNITTDENNRRKMMEDFDLLKEKLGGPGASARTAQRIVEYLKEKE